MTYASNLTDVVLFMDRFGWKSPVTFCVRSGPQGQYAHTPVPVVDSRQRTLLNALANIQGIQEGKIGRGVIMLRFRKSELTADEVIERVNTELDKLASPDSDPPAPCSA